MADAASPTTAPPGAGGSPAARPGTFGELAEAMRSAAGEGRTVRLRGSGTKSDWGTPAPREDVTIQTGALCRVLEHDAGDFTAVVEAGIRLADLDDTLREHGQMLALDPPLGAGDAATLGGVLATADSGPLRHHYGGPRDLVLGVTLVLPDGTVSRAGGKVIKNVAGYDIGKLLCGSYGTLGAIAAVAVRLHPRLRESRTVAAAAGDPVALGRAAAELRRGALELAALDARWAAGHGELLARVHGAGADEQARAVGATLAGAGLEPRVVEDDNELWAGQRAAQRSRRGTVVRVGALPDELARVLVVADGVGATVVARAGLGIAWLVLDEAGGGDRDAPGAVERIRTALHPRPCVVLDAPPAVRAAVDPWGPVDPGALAVMRSVKARFDPQGTCAPGRFVGGW